MLNLTDWQFQLMVWGFAVTAAGDITATIAEQRDGRTEDALGRPLWDNADRCRNVLILDQGRRRAVPYWYALPGVADGLARGLLEERRSGYTRAS